MVWDYKCYITGIGNRSLTNIIHGWFPYSLSIAFMLLFDGHRDIACAHILLSFALMPTADWIPVHREQDSGQVATTTQDFIATGPVLYILQLNVEGFSAAIHASIQFGVVNAKPGERNFLQLILRKCISYLLLAACFSCKINSALMYCQF